MLIRCVNDFFGLYNLLSIIKIFKKYDFKVVLILKPTF